MVLPFDNTNVAQFMNFNKAGVDTLQQSSAFAKIRANSKLFTTNVVTNADQFALKYAKIYEYAFNENNFSESLNYGNVRQHNLTSVQATKNVLSTFLNSVELDTYLTNSQAFQADSTTKTSSLQNLLNEGDKSKFNQYLHNLGTSIDSVTTINSSSETKDVHNLLTSLLSGKSQTYNFIVSMNLANTATSLPFSNIHPILNTTLLNKQYSDLQLNLKGENTSVLSADQLIRNYTNLKLGSSPYNLSPNNNSLASLLKLNKTTSVSRNNFTGLENTTNLLIDPSFVTKL